MQTVKIVSEDGYFLGWINNICENKTGESKSDNIASYVDTKLLAPTQTYFVCLAWAIGKWDLRTANSLGYSIMMNEKYSDTTKVPREYKNHHHFKSGTRALHLFHLQYIFLLQKRRAVIYIVSPESFLHIK